MFKNFILIFKVENINIELLRLNNIDENINIYIDTLLKKYNIK